VDGFKNAFANRPLAKLKKLRPSSPAKRAQAKPKDKSPPENDDKLFAEAMSGVMSIGAHDESLPPEPRIKTSPTGKEQEEAEVMQALRDLVEGETSPSIHQTDEAIEGAVAGLDPTSTATPAKKPLRKWSGFSSTPSPRESAACSSSTAAGTDPKTTFPS
jgi:hypothetical protein